MDRTRTWTVHGLIVASPWSRTGRGCGLSVDMDSSCQCPVHGMIKFVDGARTRCEHCMALLWPVLGKRRDTSQLLVGYCAEIAVDISLDTALAAACPLRGHCVDCRRICREQVRLNEIRGEASNLKSTQIVWTLACHLMQQSFNVPVHFWNATACHWMKISTH